MDIAARDRLVANFRRQVYAAADYTPFPHQAEWQLASEGWSFIDRAPIAGDFYMDVVTPLAMAGPGAHVLRTRTINSISCGIIRRAIQPRQGGAAKILADLAAFKGGKALALDTPIPTPSGWTTMGAIEVGDDVLGDDGLPTRVTGVTPAHVDPTGTFDVEFDDGTTITASGRHEWLVTGIKDRTTDYEKPATLRETRRLQDCRTNGGQRRYGILVSASWELPDQTLPLDPYVLGAWLGDGTGITGVITTADTALVERIERAGFSCRRVPSALYAWRIEGLTTILASMGLIGNKHVPALYLRASVSQRLRLLQGLMDTDGYCEPHKAVEFCNTNERLSRAVYELAISLGLKPRWREKRAMLNGRDCGPVYLVMWTSSVRVFTLPRKLKRLPRSVGGKVRYRYISRVTKVADRLVRCIAVNNASHLFLAGPSATPTHNSFGAAAWTAGFACLPDAKVHLIGAEYATAEPEFNYLADFLLSERGMNMRAAKFHNDKRAGRMIIKLRTGAEFEVKSWERKEGLKGKKITAYVYCEAYQLPGLEVYTSLSQNLREQHGWALFPTTPDRPWVGIFHDYGHGADPYWHCTCSVDASENPFTYDQAARDRDDPDKNGIMTKERYAIAWKGQLGTFVGHVYGFLRGDHTRYCTPETHPRLWAHTDADQGIVEWARG